MVKKIMALFISSILTLSIGIACAQEEKTPNPWERDQQNTTPAKKEDKLKKIDKKSQGKVKKTSKKKARKADKEKAETKKEPEQKKRFIFW